jgi:mannose/cellobiose epimerase-like protein (N-acyl-D-glucosamine 2-epimerase family)
MSGYWTEPSNFRGTIVSDPNDRGQVRAAINDIRLMVLCVLDAILKRCERDPEYALIDTKLSLTTGRDFDDSDPVRGKNTVYGWIQGRGLEALAGHDAWLSRQTFLPAEIRASFHERIIRVSSRVVERTEAMRSRNGGHLFFMMTREGSPLRVDDAGKVVRYDPPGGAMNMCDMFYAKGLAAAGRMLGRDDLVREATRMFERICEDIRAGRFYSDQQQLDPRNPVRPVPGRFGNGGRMIGIGAAALFLDVTGDRRWAETGLEFAEHMLARHSNPPSPSECMRGEPYDMWEFVDGEGRPWVKDGKLHSDPGHATEFVGLTLKLLRVAEKTSALSGEMAARANRLKGILPAVLKKNFSNGFSPRGFGIVKAFDLISRKPINPQMPWWNLPETMRAAAETCLIVPEGEASEPASIAARCSNAFMRNYVRRELGLMAVQTLDEDGSVADAIPATPDADPGYHTGLCLIDCLDVAEGNIA